MFNDDDPHGGTNHKFTCSGAEPHLRFQRNAGREDLVSRNAKTSLRLRFSSITVGELRVKPKETLDTFAIFVHGTTLGTHGFMPLVNGSRHGESALICDDGSSRLQAGEPSFEFVVREDRVIDEIACFADLLAIGTAVDDREQQPGVREDEASTREAGARPKTEDGRQFVGKPSSVFVLCCHPPLATRHSSSSDRASLDIVGQHHVSVPDVETAARYGRMSPVFSRAFRDLEGTDEAKAAW